MSDRPTGDGDRAAADGGTEVVEESPNDESVPSALAQRSEDAVVPPTMSESTHEFLLEVIRRKPLLASLQAGPAGTAELLESVEMSRSTVHRALNSLQEHGVVEVVGDEYQLTSVGTIITEEATAFANRTAAAMSLDQFLNAINGHADAVPVEHFTDATVVRREARQPHATIHRIIEFIQESERLRMFSTVISPVYVDVGYQEMMDGMEIEAIFDREVIDIMVSEYPEKAYETITTGNFAVHAHDGLPFELFISEETVGMAAHNANGNAQILIECEDEAVLEWAETLYADHLSDAAPVTL